MTEATLQSIAITLSKVEVTLEQIADDKKAHTQERHDLRLRQRDMDSDMQTLDLRLVRIEEHNLPPRVLDLEQFKWKLVGLAVGLTVMSGVVSGVLVAIITAALTP